jgi:Autographiviridae endonuclease VII
VKGLHNYYLESHANREAAIKSGATTYNGSPCKQCGLTLKLVSNYSCVACAAKRCANRSPDVGRRWRKSAKGRATLKRYKKTAVYKAVQNKYKKKDYKNNPQKYKARYIRSRGYTINYQLQKNFRISINDYNTKLAEQGHKCMICGLAQGQSRRRLPVDHNHKTGKIRGILCHSCNSALGFVHEDINILYKMIEYLRYYE